MNQNINVQLQQYKDLFCNEYLQKIFYYCLRKTTNEIEAQDLSSEISTEVIHSLEKGIIPECFSAWVWKIVRNRYSRWAKEKHISTESISGVDISEYSDLLSSGESVEDHLVHNEDLKLLRRELALISADYTNILVAYYIEDKKVCDIAKALNLPLGTVKTKLFKSRKILKEGINMAREFGKLSYNPEKVDFITSGEDGKDGSPWNLITRKIPKNILLEAYRNPSTLEQLSLELGIAVPYIEEETLLLVEGSLLKKEGNKYETNFVIINEKSQSDITNKQLKVAQNFGPKAIEWVERAKNLFDEKGINPLGDYQEYEDQKWTLLLRVVDDVCNAVYHKHNFEVKHTERPEGGQWDIMGKEQYDGTQPFFVGLHGFYCDVELFSYKIDYKDMKWRSGDDLSDNEKRTLKKVVLNQQKICDLETLMKLTEKGFLRKAGEAYIPTFAIYNNSNADGNNRIGIDKVDYKTVLEPIDKQLFDLFEEYFLYCVERIKKEIPKRLMPQLEFCCKTVPSMRGIVLEYALGQGFIQYHEDEKHNMVGVYMVV